MRWFLFFVLAACVPAAPGPEAVADPIPYASPLMGTGGFAYFHGSAFPGACVPHGLVKVGPDTRGAKYGDLRFIHYSGYWAGDDTALGFSHLHLHGAGATDWGALIVQPVSSNDPNVLNRDTYMSRFSKRSELASPGSYEITLQKWSVKAELTASTHAAHHRYTFAENDPRNVVLDLSRALAPGKLTQQTITAVDANTLKGSFLLSGQMSDGFGGNRVFFEVRTLSPYSISQTSADGHVVLLSFGQSAVELLIGVSLVSPEGATANLNAEMPRFDFDAHRATAEDAWRSKLSRVKVFGGSEADRTTFYSALRLAFLMPTVISDVDGAYVYGGERGVMPAGEPMLSDFSLWDTYRTVHPLYALVDEEAARASVSSLLRMAAQGRGLPRWPMGTGESGTMVGAPSDIVIADAVLRGVPGVDAEAAWQQVSAEALGAPTRGSRASMGSYTTLGYVPVEESDRSVGITVEYAHADFALANLARKLGHQAEADTLTTRALGWRKLFDPAHKVLRARHLDGSLVAEPYSLTSWDHYAEANALQTTFMPFWDVAGFDTMFGSREAFLNELEAFFDAAPAEEAEALAQPTYELRYLPRNHYWPSNEPDIQAPFMFARAGRPDLTAKWSDWARDTYFSSAPDGVPGNDDGGTLGSWFVFAAAGLYPVPGSDLWIVGSPLFPKIELKLPAGTFTVEAQGVSTENIYVQSARLNGVALNKAEFTQSELVDGGKLVLVMGASPSSWGH
ncbi:MAG: GH92 family glycosyl hydrolase [Archangium sp.]|nr:GH92 family glycosyl hydrolase [Archangium sp.]MDP3571080.1 GH92 family glycosyl hydrolase [Archangium sp.]